MPAEDTALVTSPGRHSDDMHDIITAVPSWILRWGISVFFAVIVLILGLSAFIRYPDIVKAELTVMSPDKPKQVVAKVSGKLAALLVQDGQRVKEGQPLAFIESTADHRKVLSLLDNLKFEQASLSETGLIKVSDQVLRNGGDLGELQPAFQTFVQSYISYSTTLSAGFIEKKRAFLEKDIAALRQQSAQLKAERAVRQRDFDLAEEEYKMHQKLEKQKVETPAELRQQESKYLSRKTPLLQNQAAVISGNTSLLAKQKEIMELDNQVIEERAKFAQALNSLISQSEEWQSKYVLNASQNGRVSFAGIIQRNQVLAAGQDVFYINSGNDHYFGQMTVPQESLGRVKTGQQVLVKLKSYPFEQFGMMRGKVGYLAEVPFKDSIFISRVDFDSRLSDMKKAVVLKQGMNASAEIITEDATLLQRLIRNMTKALNNH